MSEPEARMSFFDHLEELRQRLLRAVLAVIVGFIASIAFSEKLFITIATPLTKLLPEGTSLVFTGLPEPFFMYLKVSFVTGVFLVIPYVLYEIWKFIAPGLYAKERKTAIPFVIVATILFYGGALFAYFLVFPVVFKFFLQFQSPELQPMISIKEYVSLILKLMLAFAVIFETPVIIVFLGMLGLVDTGFLKRGRRYFVVIAFVLGAILSPPDVLSQIMMGVPLLLLYEVSIHVLAVVEKRRKKEEESLEDWATSTELDEEEADPGSK